MQIQWHYRKTARAPLSGRNHVAGSLDAAFSSLQLFRRVYPANKIPARDRREVIPPSLCDRCSGKSLTQVRRHSGFWFNFGRLRTHSVHGLGASIPAGVVFHSRADPSREVVCLRDAKVRRAVVARNVAAIFCLRSTLSGIDFLEKRDKQQ